ncbi:MAG: amidohydrolase family protein [Armatimonadota bacterium]|nr:amidohydrolase family protein [Armatimonadota bacterium]MDR7528999.1 amidohydrolase family protein [Armatimonadota bacterium]
MVTDVHAHIIPAGLTRDAAPEEAWRPRVWRDDGRPVIEVGGRQIRSVVSEIVDPDGILEAAAAAGVDCVVLSPWISLYRDDVSPQDALRTCRLCNEALARLAERRRGRLVALGMIPLQDPALAAREMAEAAAAGLRGAIVPASVGGTYLGDDRFRPVWEAAAGLGAVVFIHPTTRGFSHPAFADYYLWNAVGNPLETTIAAAHLVMSGVLEAYPTLRILLAHGGGALPALRGRLARAYQVQPAARARLREPPEASLHRLYYDTVTHDARVLKALVEFAGADHVALGSDSPFDMGDPHPVETVRALGLSPDQEDAVLGGTAARLLG